MTSTALMAVRSRSSLRVSVRQDHRDSDRDHDSDENDEPDQRQLQQPPSLSHEDSPPSKRPRLQAPVSRRRRSSPDLLDTTTTTSSSTFSPLRPTPLPRRISTRRPALSSSSSPSSLSLPPPPATPHSHSHSRLHHRHDTTTLATSASASLFLRGSRESPDPLDTISPAAPATTDPKPFSPGRSPSTVPPPRRAPPHTNPDTSSSAKKNRLQKPAPQPTGEEQSPSPPNASQSSPQALAPPQNPPTGGGGGSSSSGQKQRRSLRSHDGGSRARSELALYFPNYEQLLSLEPPKKTEFLAGHTAIKRIDDVTDLSALAAYDTDRPFGNPLLQLHNCSTISLDVVDNADGEAKDGHEDEDPLNESTYFRAHRRNERQEKQLRNIERERAQHEKQQLDRLVDELQSHDWLRVMGIGGLTDHEKKQYEPKRDFFVREISALIQKFKIWKEEEKRRKAEKDRPHAAAAETAPAEIEDSQDEQPDESSPGGVSDAPSYGDPPDINDVDAWAARQLHQEARSATAGKRPKPSAERKKSKTLHPPTPNPPQATSQLTIPQQLSRLQSSPQQSPLPPPPLPPPPPPIDENKPFTSFYSKRHIRDAALSTHRKGRVRLAFGYTVPEMEEQEFELPAEILTPEAIDSCRRKRRRMKRARE